MGQHGHDLVVVADRDRFDVHSWFAQFEVAAAAPDGTRGERRGHQRQVTVGDDGADGVPDQDRRGGVGPALGHTDQRAVIAAHPHQIVGERKVRQQLPFADHRVQVVHGAARQHRVLGEQVTEGGHES